MKIKTIVSHLKRMVEFGHGEDIICFRTKDNDKWTVTDTFVDDDDDVCLYAGDGDDYSVNDLLESLDDRCNRFVYLYCPYNDSYFSIEGVWFVDNDNDLVINLTNYNHEESSSNLVYDDDEYDDDEYDDDEYDDDEYDDDEYDDDEYDDDDDEYDDDEYDDDEYDDEYDDESDERCRFLLNLLYINSQNE